MQKAKDMPLYNALTSHGGNRDSSTACLLTVA